MPLLRADLLPPQWPVERLAACFGLVSDTHLPERLSRLPAALFEVLRGVDLVLHAGDVGELRVLDELSRIAPVIGVHGNDDTAEAQATLPYAQVVAVAGRRILLCHSHYPDRALELASRQGDDWGPKLDRRAELGRPAGATIVVYGHTHIPMALDHAGVLLVNPGALASGNAHTRQTRQTVALLAIRDDGAPVVVHVDLAEPARAYVPRLDLAAGFAAALAHYSASILSPDLERAWPRLVAAFSAEEQTLLRPVVLRVAHRCWAGLQATMSAADLRAEFQSSADLPPALRARAEAALDDSLPDSR